MLSILLAIDAGSSSIRCTPYEYCGDDYQKSHQIDNVSSDGGSPPLKIRAMDEMIHTVRMASIVPDTGYIRIHEVLSAIDKSVDEVLRLLRLYDGNSDDDSASQPPSSSTKRSFRIVAIGFSTFVMNLIGVDKHGEPIGESGTLSYACNREEVVRECQEIRAELGPDKLKALYQRTGAPIHPAYALPQLRAFYKSRGYGQIGEKVVDRWQTISSICLHRWTGGGNKIHTIPISYSEASWTGMMNFRTCTWDEEVMQLLASCLSGEILSFGDASNIANNEDKITSEDIPNEANYPKTLPPLADFDGFILSENLNTMNTSDSMESPPSDWQKNTVVPFLRAGIPPHRADGKQNPYWDRWPELRGHHTDAENKDHGDEGQMHCMLFLGIGDGAAANIGSKCGGNFSLTSSSSFSSLPVSSSLEGNCYRIAVTIGTSAAARVCLFLPIAPRSSAFNSSSKAELAIGNEGINSVIVPPGLFCYRVDRNRVLLGGALTDGGSVVEWARSLLNLQTKESFNECLSKVSKIYNCGGNSSLASSSNRVIMIPFLSGERSTGFRGGARACLSGMTRETTSTDIMCACLEGVTLRIGAVLKLMNEVYQPVIERQQLEIAEHSKTNYTRLQSNACQSFGTISESNGRAKSLRKSILIASGNALEVNSLWRQMLADCSGLDVIVDGDSKEGTSRGVAMLIIQSMNSKKAEGDAGGTTSFDEPLVILHRARANSAVEGFWRQLSLGQENLIDAVKPTWFSS